MISSSTSESYQLFLAYAGPDRAVAENLFELVQAHIPTFFDGKSLKPEDRFDVAIPKAHTECCATAILISRNWSEALYAQSEVARAIALSRKGLHCLVAVWLEALETEHRPYGLETAVGIQLTEAGGLEAVAKETIDSVRRWQDRLKDGHTPSAADIISHETMVAHLKMKAVDDLAREHDLQRDDIRRAYDKVMDKHIINIRIYPPWGRMDPFTGDEAL